MARLAHRRLALVVTRHSAVGRRAGPDVAPVVDVDGRRDRPATAADAQWQRAPPRMLPARSVWK